MNLQDVRNELEREIGRPLPEGIWNYLEAKGYARDALLAAMSIPELGEEARLLLGALGEETARLTPREAVPRSTKGSIKYAVLSKIIASQARKDDDVRWFREHYLPNGCLRSEEVEGWIESKSAEAGRHTQWLRMPLPDDVSIKPEDRAGVGFSPSLEVDRLQPPYGLSVDSLQYAHPDGWARSLPVKVGSPLAYLAQIGEALAKRYGWQEAQATTFLLTDIVPAISQIRLSTQLNLELPVLTRITLTIDPALTPRQVQEAYSQTRRDLLGSRYRNLSEKHLALVGFLADRPEEESWTEAMNAWNESCPPKDKYSRVSTFSRDGRAATQRLLQPDINVFGARRQLRR